MKEIEKKHGVRCRVMGDGCGKPLRKK